MLVQLRQKPARPAQHLEEPITVRAQGIVPPKNQMRTVRSLKNLGKVAVVPTPAVALTPSPALDKVLVVLVMAMVQVKAPVKA